MAAVVESGHFQIQNVIGKNFPCHLKAVISVLAISAQFHQPATSAFLEADRFDGLLSGLPCRRYKVYKLRGNLFVSVFLYEVPCVRDAGNLSIGEML